MDGSISVRKLVKISACAALVGASVFGGAVAANAQAPSGYVHVDPASASSGSVPMDPASASSGSVPMDPASASSCSMEPGWPGTVPADPQIYRLLRSPGGGRIPISDLTEIHLTGVKTLAGLEYATNLRVLHAEGGCISDLTPLRGLRHLRVVVLSSNKIQDVSPLAGLNLNILSLNDNKITSIEPFRHMAAPSGDVGIQNNYIADVSPLDHWFTGRGRKPSHVDVEGQGQPNDEEGTFEAIQAGTVYVSRRTRSAVSDISAIRASAGAQVEYSLKEPDKGEVHGNTVSWSDVPSDATKLRLMFRQTGVQDPAFAGTLNFDIVWVDDAVSSSVKEWDPRAHYTKGTHVTYEGGLYEALQTHQGHGDSNWIKAPSLWLKIG